MPSANASRKGQEKPREIVDAAEVGFLLPRVGARAEGGSGAIGAPAALGAPHHTLPAGRGVGCRAAAQCSPRTHRATPGRAARAAWDCFS
ncbi:hypothetical protein LEMLEM_LOCUS23656 [Lemmus lemmus]